jgi:Trp operon repressor
MLCRRLRAQLLEDQLVLLLKLIITRDELLALGFSYSIRKSILQLGEAKRFLATAASRVEKIGI